MPLDDHGHGSVGESRKHQGIQAFSYDDGNETEMRATVIPDFDGKHMTELKEGRRTFGRGSPSSRK